MKNYKFLEHTADIKFQAFGKSLEKVFENSAKALIKSIYKNKIKKIQTKPIKVKGKDFESLLYNFLEEIIVLLDTDNFLCSRVKNINIDKNKFTLTAELIGDSSEKYKIETHVKAITLSEMFVKQEGKKWVAQVVVDI